ncbi:hypothetical protein [Kocuria rosea]|uniref:hypothetical protein n=1 Tax=Kocuria rosea TaxID=1275 RepID=UPI003D330D9B
MVWLMCGTGILVSLTGWSLWNRRLAPESAAFLFVLATLTAAALAGYLFGGINITRGSAAAFAITAPESLEAAWILLRFSFIFLVSSVVLHLFVRRPLTSSKNNQRSRRSRQSLESTFGRHIVNAIVLLLTIYVLVLYPLIGTAVLSRDEYLFLAAGSLGALAGTVSLPLALVAMTVAVGTDRGSVRLWSATVLLLVLTFEVSKASRAAAGVMVFAGFIYFLLSRSSLPKRLLGLFVGIVLGSLTLVIVLQLRGSDIGHGMLPYIELLTSGDVTLSSERWESAVLNLMATIPITYLSSTVAVPDNLTFVSLSPLPGELAGWYEISSSQVLFRAVPTNAYGQVAAMESIEGWVCIFLIAGLMSASAIVRSYGIPAVQMPLMFFSSTMTILTSILFMQYSIRTGTRWLWLALGVTVMVSVLSRLMQRRVPVSRAMQGAARVGTWPA